MRSSPASTTVWLKVSCRAGVVEHPERRAVGVEARFTVPWYCRRTWFCAIFVKSPRKLQELGWRRIQLASASGGRSIATTYATAEQRVEANSWGAHWVRTTRYVSVILQMWNGVGTTDRPRRRECPRC